MWAPLLLPMDDVRFGEDRAAAGEPLDGAGLPHQAGVVLQFQSQPGHLILKEGAGTSGAVFIYRKPGRGVLIQAGEEAGALAADFNGGAGFRGQQPDAEVDGWDLPSTARASHPSFSRSPAFPVMTTGQPQAPGPRLKAPPADGGRSEPPLHSGKPFFPKELSLRGKQDELQCGVSTI